MHISMERKFLWHGLYSYRYTDHNPEDLKELLTPYKQNLFIKNLISGYAARFPGKVKIFATEDQPVH